MSGSPKANAKKKVEKISFDKIAPIGINTIIGPKIPARTV